MRGTIYEPMTLRDHLRVLRRRRLLLMAVVVACAAGAAAWAFLSAPVYEARAELVVVSDAGPRSAVLSAAAPVLSMLGEPVAALGGDDLATQMQIIESRPTLEDAWGLMHERPEVLDRLERVGLTDELLEELPGIVERLGEQPPPSRWPDEWQELLDTLMVAPLEESEVIEVRCEAPDPARARDFVNALVLAHLGRSLGDARAATRRTRTYVEEQLDDVEVRLAEAEEALRQFGGRVGTVALDEAARQQIGLLVRLNEQVAVAESTLKARQALQDELEAELAAVDERVVASTVTRRNPEITELQGELARAEAERVSLLEEYAPGSMPVRRAMARVEELRARLQESAAEVIDSRQEAINPVAQEIAQQMIVAEGEEIAAKQSMRVLREAVARVEGELAGLPDEQVALLKLQREIELLERVYLALKEKQQEYEITERAKAPASRLVSRAIAPDEPARPRKLLTVAGGLMAGMLLGLLAVGLAEHLDERLRDSEHAANLLGAPVLGVLGDRGQADGVLRSIRRHIAALSRDADGPDVLVLASTADCEGALAVAEGLASVARADGETVLVVTPPGTEKTADPGRQVDLNAAFSPRADAQAVGRLLTASGADVVLAVPPPDSGLLTAVPLLQAGCPVALVVDLQTTPMRAALSIGELCREHARAPVVAIVIGARRSSADYLTPGTRA